MHNEQQSCTRDDLEGLVLQSVVVSLTDAGNGRFVEDRCDVDWEAVDEYRCTNCDKHWDVGNKYDVVSRAQAWRAALDHLRGREGSP